MNLTSRLLFLAEMVDGNCASRKSSKHLQRAWRGRGKCEFMTALRHSLF